MALLVALAAMGTMPAVAAGEEPEVIDDCTTIDEPGHYVLDGTLTDDQNDNEPCISIEAGDVTLDGQGNLIQFDDGTPQDGDDGIRIDTPDNDDEVTIENVEVTGFDDGIRILSGHVTLENVDTHDNIDDGIDANDASFVGVYDSRVKNNGDEGIEMDNVDESEVEESYVAKNTWDGIDIEGGETQVLDNQVRKNGKVQTTSMNLQLPQNPGEGIDLDGVHDSVVKNNHVKKNGGEGLELETNKMGPKLHNVKVKDNEIKKNGKNGIDVDGVGESVEVEIIKNDIRKNKKYGLSVYKVKDLKVDDNTILDNYKGQIKIIDSVKVDIGHNDIGL
ncbi:right-handed parallel beta-helix repeat-containing protein [Halorientalis brevis]|uniref:Right-handed parallel beta-helix repeat-containing protein n=1 Tax=Halorientalis brevis TaxID=1126241 RepID=A0ABD6CGI5_9EURY